MSWLFSRKQDLNTDMVPWIQLKDMSDLDEIVNRSSEKPQLIFKHSTRCGRSSSAMRRLEESWDIDEKNVDIWYLDLLEHRGISNEIANRFGVHHQSPQVILIKNGEAVFDASHESIAASAITGQLG